MKTNILIILVMGLVISLGLVLHFNSPTEETGCTQDKSIYSALVEVMGNE